MQRILVVDDDEMVTRVISTGLAYKGFEAFTARCGSEALQKVQRYVPDLVVLDIMLPDGDGCVFCHQLRDDGNSLPILLLSARDETRHKIMGLESGADDYITKPFDFEELVARIRAALRRREQLLRKPEVLVAGDIRIDTASYSAWRGEEKLALSRREYDLLELFVRNAGHVLSKGQIFEHVWGYDHDAGYGVVKVYINYLRGKLNAGGKPDVIHGKRGFGYVLKPQS